MKIIQSSSQLIAQFEKTIQNFNPKSFSLQVVITPDKKKIRVKNKNKTALFYLITELHPSRKFLKRTFTKKTSDIFLVCPHIPNELADDLRNASINFADLNGNFFLTHESFLIERQSRTQFYRGPVVDADLFSPKSSRILRSLLSHPDKKWNQKELLEATETSPGLISRILKTLAENDFIIKTTNLKSHKSPSYLLKDSIRLLDSWKNADEWKKRVQIYEYSLLIDNPLEIAKTIQKEFNKENIVFTQWFAASLRHPYTTPPLVSAYVKEITELKIPFARPVNSGGNLWLIVPNDEGVFLEKQTVKGFQLVTDTQIYLDLLQVGQRGPDQAEELKKWAGFNK